MDGSIRPGIEIANLTDVGCERTENQDYSGYFEPESDDEFRRKGRLIIVADGMGGHAGGAVASRLAVELILQTYKESPPSHPTELLKEGFEKANARIIKHAQQHPDLADMGTTCTALALQDGHACFAHVGDSRAYLIRDDHILQLTHDHSVIEEMIAEGLIGREEARDHPQKNVITRALGMGPQIEVDVSQIRIPLFVGDTFLVCSDGLTGLVADEEIKSTIANHPTSEAGSQLLNLALSRGGHDNITIQIVRVTGERQKNLRTTRPDTGPFATVIPSLPKRRQIKKSFLIFLVGLVIAVVLILVGFQSLSRSGFLRRIKAHFVSQPVHREVPRTPSKTSGSGENSGSSKPEKDKTAKKP
jgi:serine/threonine protein phosphatase PrpC